MLSAMTTGNMYRKFHDVRTCRLPYATKQTDIQTERHTQIHPSQYVTSLLVAN